MYGTTPHYRPSLSGWRVEYKTLLRRYGPGTAGYGLAWNVCFSAGLYAQRVFDVYRIRRRLRASDLPTADPLGSRESL